MLWWLDMSGPIRISTALPALPGEDPKKKTVEANQRGFSVFRHCLALSPRQSVNRLCFQGGEVITFADSGASLLLIVESSVI